jgi:hypothetical protein
MLSHRGLSARGSHELFHIIMTIKNELSISAPIARAILQKPVLKRKSDIIKYNRAEDPKTPNAHHHSFHPL